MARIHRLDAGTVHYEWDNALVPRLEDLRISEIVDAPNWIISAFLPECIFT